jgi:SMI1/KNR4 family protein SUKH-1
MMLKDSIQALMTKVQRTRGEQPKPASSEELKRAGEAGFPGDLIELYRECNPDDCIELKQRIWSIDNALVENHRAVPGCYLFPHGFIVFASNLGGDSYCIDTNVTTEEGCHPVVLFSHEMIEEDTPVSKIQSLRLEVANSLQEFLVKFANEELVEEPLYG